VKRCAAGLALAGMVFAAAFFDSRVSAEAMLGFRLLNLDGTKVKWGADKGAPATVTYAFVRERMQFASARNCTGMDSPDELLAASKIDRALFEREVRTAFDMWEQVTNIVFREISDVTTAGILIGAQLEPEGHAFANVVYRPGESSIREIEKSLICLNPVKQWKVGFDGSLAVYDVRYTIAHEIGHAIGLDHPDSGGQLMSFTYHERFRDLQVGDIEGAIRLYGTRQSPRPVKTGSPSTPAVRFRRQG
jgi:Matrixin